MFTVNGFDMSCCVVNKGLNALHTWCWCGGEASAIFAAPWLVNDFPAKYGGIIFICHSSEGIDPAIDHTG